RHPGAVFGYVIEGKWHYHEHPWVAEAGHFVYEPPGEIHTLAVPEDCDHMVTFFNISGAMVYVDDDGVQTGYEDVFTKIEMARAHYESVGLGNVVDDLIR
ncbi:2,4'-dihydroxyacetophenone dioxygenase family protein, partial [Nocardiopsis tropica]|nr:2,4'-dihydroxyacetophenone dioxygenase family protein [Nocardiopsis tropica]